MSARQIINSLVTTTRCHGFKPQTLKASYQTRQFFGGRNWDPFSDLNTALKEIERNSKELEKQFQKMGKNLGLPPLPTRSIPIQGLSSNSHQITLDLSGFKAEDVKVKLDGQVLKITAKMEQQSEDGTQTISQEIARTYTLPEDVEVERMKSLLSEDGVLCIEAPLKTTKDTAKGPTEIPIDRKSDQETPQG